MKKKNLIKYLVAFVLVFISNFGVVSAGSALPTMILLYGMQPTYVPVNEGILQLVQFRLFLFLFFIASLITGVVVFFKRKYKSNNKKNAKKNP